MMRSKKVFFLLFLLFSLNLTTALKARQTVIYGDDNRVDLYEMPDGLFKELARSTSAMMPKHALIDKGDHYLISGRTLAQKEKVCKSARFSEQLAVATCSGFLVGKDLLVTAGHCIQSAGDCAGSFWVFDFNLEGPRDLAATVLKNQVYSCKKIISQTLGQSAENDFAFIQLDREVLDRDPLAFRKKGKISKRADLLVIGHPSGLPTKVADGAYVRKNRHKFFFKANLDAFAGNSGSAVFNQATGLVEGILVRGETDYVYDGGLGCYVPNRCSNKGCRGEDVVRITNIKRLMGL